MESPLTYGCASPWMIKETSPPLVRMSSSSLVVVAFGFFWRNNTSAAAAATSVPIGTSQRSQNGRRASGL